MSDPTKDTEEKKLYHARKLWEIGVEQLINGNLELALSTFEESLNTQPTAEGYTFRGWARSYKGRFDDAISDCRRAINLDPDFGNPYNDIGVYLMQLGRLDAAISWLQKAKVAPRYENPHFPFLNLGHVYMMQGQQNLALIEFVEVLEMDPDNRQAKKAIAQMEMDFF